MSTVRFHAVIGQDGVIRPPVGVELVPGEAEVIVRTADAESLEFREKEEPKTSHLFDCLARTAEEFDMDLPTDLAENHDHYAHGAPKGVDRE